MTTTALTTTTPLKLFQLLQTLDESITPERCKIHLAVHNGQEDPIDVYLAGNFDRWQEEQTRKNFTREFIVSLVKMPQRNRWLFAGIHEVQHCERNDTIQRYLYTTARRANFDSMCGRLVVHFERPKHWRQSYPFAERLADDMSVAELRPEPYQLGAFPGFTNIILSKSMLKLMVQQQDPSWMAALSSVSGVYAITDTLSGKLYIGSAYGEGGIWSRWAAYAATGHGDNTELRDLLIERGEGYASNFQFGILETADSHASPADIIARESHWKTLLQSRLHGYNGN